MQAKQGQNDAYAVKCAVFCGECVIVYGVSFTLSSWFNMGADNCGKTLHMVHWTTLENV